MSILEWVSYLLSNPPLFLHRFYVSFRIIDRNTPFLDVLKVWGEDQIDAALQKSPLDKAIFYMLNHLDSLNRSLNEGFLKQDNNKAEQHIRPVAWEGIISFVGSDRGRKAAANCYSLRNL